MIRSKLTAARREINAKYTLIKKLQKENLILKYGNSQSEVKSMRRLLGVIKSKFKKFKISHRHLVQKLKSDNNALRNQVCNIKADNDILQSTYNSKRVIELDNAFKFVSPVGTSFEIKLTVSCILRLARSVLMYSTNPFLISGTSSF